MSPWDGDESDDSSKDLVAVWLARCRGTVPPVLDGRNRSRALDYDSGRGRGFLLCSEIQKVTAGSKKLYVEVICGEQDYMWKRTLSHHSVKSFS